MYEIDKNIWHECKICNKKIKDLAKIYGGCGVYYTIVFTKHLETEHNMTNIEYFEKYTTRPKCPCNICDNMARLRYIKWANFSWFYHCGRYPGTLKWSEDAKVNRAGEGNPMYGATPWNSGKTAENNSSIRKTSEKLTGRIVPQEVKNKQSESAKKRKTHGHTGFKHSEENKIKFRENTLRMIKDGKFKQNKTKPFLKMVEILNRLNLRYEEEVSIDCWSIDLYLKDYNIYIEVDGDYWHSNPKVYPTGPKTSTQKINHSRDCRKNQYMSDNNHILLRFWESDILNNPEEVICRLKKYLVLDI